MKKLFAISVMCACALFATKSYSSVVVLSDQFDNYSLDPAWAISYTGDNIISGSHGLFSETTDFTVTSVGDHVNNNGLWGYTNLTRTFGPLSNFDVTFKFGWNNALGPEGFSDYSSNAMERVEIRLFDALGNTVAQSGYVDAWIGALGSAQHTIGSISDSSGSNSLGFYGNPQATITRDNTGLTSISWDGSEKLTGYTTAEVVGVQVIFGHYTSHNSTYTGDVSYFSNEWVNEVTITTVIPVPAAVWLFGSGLLGLVGIARRKKTA